MRQLGSFHHYSAADHHARLPIELLEERVVALLVDSPVPDSDRDSSIAFELKHSSAVTQFARLLARKRELPVDACAAGGLLHDIYVVTSGSYTDHAHRGVPIAAAMVDQVGGFSDREKAAIAKIVGHHSDKHVFSQNAFEEFGKDVDVLDAFLYPGAFDWYLGNKPLATFVHYLTRARTVWAELGLAPDPRFSILAGYGQNWLDASCPLGAPDDNRDGDANVLREAATALLVKDGSGWVAHFNTGQWQVIARASGFRDARDAVQALLPGMPSVLSDGDPLALMLWPTLGRFETLERSPAGKARLNELCASSPLAQGGEA